MSEKQEDILDEFYSNGASDYRRVDSDANHAAYESARRGLWATAALGALGYLAIMAGVFALTRNRWDEFLPSIRCIVLVFALACTYAVSYLASRAGNPPLSKLFCIFGTLLFGVSLALLSQNAPTDLGASDWLATLIADAFPSIAGFWTVGAFILAATQRSRALHYCASLIMLYWIVTDLSGVDAQITIVFCALGEYWAWRRKSASVAAVYFTLSVWVLCTELSLWTQRESWVLVAVALSVVFYWFGANFNIAPVRGAALFIAACALGCASFPQYWSAMLSEGALERFGHIAAPRALAALCSAMFLAYCVNVTLGGVQHCMTRFVFGVFAIFVWTVGQSVSASHAFGSLGAFCVLIFVAACFFGLVALERSLRAKNDKSQTSRRVHSSTVLVDDPEFDDPIEAEARVRQNAEPVLALALTYDAFWAYVARVASRPAVGVAVALQFALVLAVFAFHVY